MAASISGKIVLITGASSGIGKAIAETLAKDGATVALMARSIEKLREIEDKIKSNGGSCFAVQGDVTDRQQVEEAVKKIESECGSIDILINNAGVLLASPIQNMKVDEWMQIVDVNIKGVLHCVGATLGPMVEKGRGHIINVSSTGGKQAATSAIAAAPYYGSKFFVQGFTSGMRQELAPKGIKVSTVCPGGTMTDIFGKITDADANKVMEEFMGSDPQKVMESEMVLFPQDIADTVSYMLKQPSRVALNDVVVEPRAMPSF